MSLRRLGSLVGLRLSPIAVEAQGLRQPGEPGIGPQPRSGGIEEEVGPPVAGGGVGLLTDGETNFRYDEAASEEIGLANPIGDEGAFQAGGVLDGVLGMARALARGGQKALDRGVDVGVGAAEHGARDQLDGMEVGFFDRLGSGFQVLDLGQRLADAAGVEQQMKVSEPHREVAGIQRHGAGHGAVGVFEPPGRPEDLDVALDAAGRRGVEGVGRVHQLGGLAPTADGAQHFGQHQARWQVLGVVGDDAAQGPLIVRPAPHVGVRQDEGRACVGIARIERQGPSRRLPGPRRQIGLGAWRAGLGPGGIAEGQHAPGYRVFGAEFDGLLQ